MEKGTMIGPVRVGCVRKSRAVREEEVVEPAMVSK